MEFLSDQVESFDSEFKALVRENYTTLEFVISIRVDWLPFRSGNMTSIEMYNPHICGRQFGYDQVVPQSILDFTTMSKDISALAECWLVLVLRHETHSFFSIPSYKQLPQFSQKYLLWHSMHLKAYVNYPINDASKSSNKSQGKRLRDTATIQRTFGFEFDVSKSTNKRLKRSTPEEGTEVQIEVTIFCCIYIQLYFFIQLY